MAPIVSRAWNDRDSGPRRHPSRTRRWETEMAPIGTRRGHRREAPAGPRRSRASLVEGDDPAGACAVAQPVESALEVVEADSPVDQALDREPAGQVQRGVAGEVN